jgi:hypothetical protein
VAGRVLPDQVLQNLLDFIMVQPLLVPKRGIDVPRDVHQELIHRLGASSVVSPVPLKFMLVAREGT